MKKLLISIFLIAFLSSIAGASIINGDCVYLNDILGSHYQNIGVQCGFQPGDSRVLPAATIVTSLKRAGLPVPENLAPNYTVTRSGIMLPEATIVSSIEGLYQSAYPGKTIKVESIRLNKPVYLSPDAGYEILIDTGRFGASTGAVVSGSSRNNFSYTVKAYEEIYVSTGRINRGEVLAGMVKKELVDVSSLRGTPVATPELFIAERAIIKGKAITMDMVAAKPDKLKGDNVLLVYHSGDIKIEVAGVAEGSAVVGKSFPVKNQLSGLIVNAVYQGNGLAMIN